MAGRRRLDVDDPPPGWGEPASLSAPVLDPATATRALAPIRHLVAYGSEDGQPCSGPYCCG